ncbi:UNVERIFIED_CONTAM: hypothetical protein HDU68_003319 [Siphonaria sp. JEL0065]|nr:hypothetical protein HDU68_003319 [Siphonaria sp. JEL0065]
MPINTLPTEILLQIFLRIDPSKVFLFRRVSKRVDAILLCKYFAILSLNFYHSNTQQHTCDNTNINRSYVNLAILRKPAAIERLITYTPTSYQNVYTEKYLKSVTRITWILRSSSFEEATLTSPCKIPPSFGSLQHLVHLFMRGVCGSLPLEICSLQSLKLLDLSFNKELNGTIPKEIGGLTNLEFLYISHCALSGSLPKEVSGMTALKYFMLGNNQLDDCIPDSIGELMNLQGLCMERNQISGEIPREIGALAKLEKSALEGNCLCGEIPKEIAGLVELRDLSLKGNRLSGKIPPEILELRNLQSWDLSENTELECSFAFPLLHQ